MPTLKMHRWMKHGLCIICLGDANAQEGIGTTVWLIYLLRETQHVPSALPCQVLGQLVLT